MNRLIYFNELMGNRPNKTKSVFISHPYIDNPKSNIESADRICKYVLSQGYVPISPLHLFKVIPPSSDKKYRAFIMFICKILILTVDEVWIFGTSKGCKDEEKFAKKINKRIRIMYPKEKPKGFYKRLMQEKTEIKF